MAGISFDGQIEGTTRKQIEKLSQDSATSIHGGNVSPNPLAKAKNRRTKMKSCTLTSEHPRPARPQRNQPNDNS
jgi:hypothetical protein